MENKSKSTQSTPHRQELVHLAEGILSEEIFTSQHLYYIAKENDDAWLDLVIQVFPLGDMVNAIVDIIKDCGPRGVLFYNYKCEAINKNEEIPKFDEVFYISGDDYKALMDLLIEIKRSRLH